jgi:G3E family GTPase
MLDNTAGLKIAVIVNDMSVVNIDARLVRRTEEKMIELSNGCICCTLREDLLEQLIELGQTSDADAIVIECTGIAEPIHVAETFAHSKTIGKNLDCLVALDTMVTVVDSKYFHEYFKGTRSPEFLPTETKACSSERTLVDLLIDQVQFADVIIVNKTDCISVEKLEDVSAVLRDLNPHARQIRSSYGIVDPKRLINTHLFSFERAEQHAQWFAEEWGSAELTPESEEYGISSFVFRSNRPFHPGRLKAFFDAVQDIAGADSFSGPVICGARELRNKTLTHRIAARSVIRCKGFLWIASRNDHVVLMHLAGGSVHLTRGGKWWADQPRHTWPSDPEFRREVLGNWSEPYGDRSQTLVVIGLHMQADSVRAALSFCLLTDAELSLGPRGWKKRFVDELTSTSAAVKLAEAAGHESSEHVHDESCPDDHHHNDHHSEEQQHTTKSNKRTRTGARQVKPSKKKRDI